LIENASLGAKYRVATPLRVSSSPMSPLPLGSRYNPALPLAEADRPTHKRSTSTGMVTCPPT
jgi:hypothetical protein